MCFNALFNGCQGVAMTFVKVFLGALLNGCQGVATMLLCGY